MNRLATICLAAALAAAGCAGTVLRPTVPDAEEMADIKARILELQRSAAMAEVELERLRQELVALEERLGGPAAAGTQRPAPRSVPPAAVEPPPPRPPVVIEVEPTAPPAAPPAAQPLPAPPSAPSAPSVPATPASPEPDAATALQPVSEAAQALYDRGYTLYHQGRYVDSEAGFRRFVQAYPDTALSDNALFWIGECRYARGDLEGALAAFREVVDRYPDGNKVADSLLKAADCLRGLGDAEGARAGYQEVMSRFPGSAAAAVAEERVRQL